MEGMNEGAAGQHSCVVWRLNGTSGTELTCELCRTGHEVRLRFCSGAELLHETALMAPAEADSWTRIWRAYYLTSGWSAPGPSRRSRRSRIPRRAAPQVRTGPILRYWTRTDHEGGTVACELVRTETGLEVRFDGPPQRTQPVRSMTEALALAEAWKSVVPV
jgi:hypothetical protein